MRDDTGPFAARDRASGEREPAPPELERFWLRLTALLPEGWGAEAQHSFGPRSICSTASCGCTPENRFHPWVMPRSSPNGRAVFAPRHIEDYQTERCLPHGSLPDPLPSESRTPREPRQPLPELPDLALEPRQERRDGGTPLRPGVGPGPRGPRPAPRARRGRCP